MQTPLQITYEGLPSSEAVTARLEEEAQKLQQFHERITSMRVVVARPHHRHVKGDAFQVRLHIEVPGGPDIAISREPGESGAHDDVYVTIRDAFKAAKRQLRDMVEKR